MTVVTRRIGFVSVSILLISSISPPPVPEVAACLLNESSSEAMICHLKKLEGWSVIRKGKRLPNKKNKKKVFGMSE